MSSSIIFENLRAEMARKNLTITQMARECGYTRETLARKLSGKSPLFLDDAFKITKKYFNDLDVSYLFNELNECMH